MVMLVGLGQLTLVSLVSLVSKVVVFPWKMCITSSVSHAQNPVSYVSLHRCFVWESDVLCVE